MKATELMIGDWVMVNDIEHTHPLQVAEIFKKCGAYYATLYWDGMPDNVNPETLIADVEKVEPIPLTPEILEKNGLEKDNHGRLNGEYFDEDINQDLEITVDSKTGEIWWSYNWDEYYIIRLRYVHQLQHALRLCEIKKEIVI